VTFGTIAADRGDLTRMLDAVPLLVASCDRDYRYTYVNQSYAARFRKTPAELIGRTMRDIVGPEIFAAVLPLVERVLAGERVESEMTLTYPDSGVQTLRSALTPVRDDAGAIVGWDGVGEIITEQRRAEERFRELADSMPQIVWSANADGVTDYYNRQWYARTRTSCPDEADAMTFVHPDDREICQERWRTALATGRAFEQELRLRFPGDDDYRWYLGRTLPVRDDAGNVVRWYGTSTDIDDQKRVERALIGSQQRLIAADRQKDVFLGMLAHELRNPLAPLVFAAAALERRAADPATKRPLEIMRRQVERISRLVDDLLDISRITEGKIVLRRESLDLGAVLLQAIDVVPPALDEARHTIDVELADDVRLSGDPQRLGQVFENLLGNAVKYTPREGRIVVQLRRDGRDAVVAIRDNGVGIAAEALTRVFELFVQVDGSLDRAQGGLGVGLTLVDRLTRLHGGSVTAASGGLNQGSEFIVRLSIE
jgi:PAS domain S-box-containing protein